jgi:diguanylate cyclase (GGDEF)-like protein
MLNGPRLSPDDKRDRRALMEDIDLLTAEPAGTFRNETLEHITRMSVGTGHIHIHLIVSLTRDPEGRPDQVLVQLRDVTAQQAHQAWLATQTQTDPLTGLGNQLAMQERLREEIGALRFGDNGLGVMMIDLDNFRTVNDRLGHPAGDDLLCRMTTALVTALPVEAFASRVGGDEFVVLAPSDSAEQLRALADQVSTALSEAANYFSERLQVLVGASIGLTFTQNPAIDPEELIMAADSAMYETKRQRRSGTSKLKIEDVGPRPTLYALPSPRGDGGNEPLPAPTPAPRVSPEAGESSHPAQSRQPH